MNSAARSISVLDVQRPATGSLRARISEAASPPDLHLITDRQDFDALEDEWNDLFARAGHPTHVFQSFNFCWHWANHYLASSVGGLAGIHLSILTGRRDGRLVMVWPLVSERVRGITQTFWMGEPVAQYGDVLIDAGDDVVALMREALAFLRSHSQSDLLRLRRVRSDSNLAPLLTETAQCADRQVAPYMDLTTADDFAAFEQRYSAKTRKNRRRLARRLEEKGSVEFVRLRGGPEARALAEKALDLKARWLKDRGLVSNAIANARMARLLADLAEGAVKPAGCIVSGLKSNGDAASLEISFACKGRLAMHLIVFDLAHEKSGAGVLLFEQSLRDGFREGFHVYDMLAPGDAYKFDWCDQADAVSDWVKPLSLKGNLYTRFYLTFLRPHAKALLKAVPQPLRRLLREGFTRTASIV
jgi:CelD/BcsL family acetyltransferase involved in cellulose biosynthesis